MNGWMKLLNTMEKDILVRGYSKGIISLTSKEKDIYFKLESVIGHSCAYEIADSLLTTN